jgi:hypothetical protein
MKNVQIALAKEKIGLNASFNWNALVNYLGLDSSTYSASAKTLTSFSGGCWFPLSLYDSGSNLPIKRIWNNQRYTSAGYGGGNKYLTASATNPMFMLTNGSVVIFGLGATPTIVTRYVKAHSDLSASGTSDILVPSPFWYQVLDLALKEANIERGVNPAVTDTNPVMSILTTKEQSIEQELGASGGQ